ncbi:hypothetical protein EZS27_008461 [termite gut metagenome]|uniref:Uncharacterized protein n=1 Tax=termite gut metagenome TaxID=433724 RepID=A0A5J4SF20_9ZZZZ
MHAAILFLIFNRPDTSKRVFEIIRQVKPLRFYIAADGPRNDEEIEICEKTRSIIEKIDWDCEVKTLFRKENLGCGKAVSSALTWFFDNESEGIILEDDIIPHLDFFPYCEELLEKYRATDQIYAISGHNHLYGEKANEDSYYFSSICHIWGWASWRRAWKAYDYSLEAINKKEFFNILRYYCDKSCYRNFWKLIFFQMKDHLIDTWDYQWGISLMYNKALCIIPNTNLTQNIGFGENATHTKKIKKKILDYKGRAIFPLKHPQNIFLNREGDRMDIIKNKRCISDIRYVKRYVLFKLKILLNGRFKF